MIVGTQILNPNSDSCCCANLGQFEEQQDSNVALVLPNEASLRMSLGPAHNLFSWSTDRDGKVHSYTLNLAIKLDKLPSASLLLFHGRGLAAEVASNKASSKPGATTSQPTAADSKPTDGKNSGRTSGAGGLGGSASLECVRIYKNGGVGEGMSLRFCMDVM